MKSRFRNISLLLVLMMCVVAFAPAETATSATDAQVEMMVDMDLTETVQTDVVMTDADNSNTTFLYVSAPEEPEIVDEAYLQAEELNYRQIEKLTYTEPILTRDKWPCNRRLI